MCAAPKTAGATQTLGSTNVGVVNSRVDPCDQSMGSITAAAAVLLLEAEVERDAAQLKLASSRLRLAFSRKIESAPTMPENQYQ